MKKLIYILLLLPLSSFAQISYTNLNLEADTIRLETHGGRNTAQRVGRMFKNIISNPFTLTNVGSSGAATYNNSTGVLNIPVYTAGAGITNSAANLELMMSDGSNAVSSGIFQGTNISDLNLGKSTTTGSNRIFKALGNGGGEVDIELLTQSSSGKTIIENTGSQAVLQIGSGGTNAQYTTAAISSSSKIFTINGETTINSGAVAVGSASLTTIATIPSTSGKSMYMKVKLIGRWSSGPGSSGDSSFQGYTIGVKNISGTLSLFTSSHDYNQTSAVDAPNVITFTISGSNILVQTQTNTSTTVYNCTAIVTYVEAN